MKEMTEEKIAEFEIDKKASPHNKLFHKAVLGMSACTS
jgi:hypothetical protein